MIGYRIRAAMGRGREWLGRAMECLKRTRIMGAHRSAAGRPANHANAPARASGRAAFASLLLLLLCAGLPAKALAACAVPLTFHSGQTTISRYAADANCDPSGLGFGPSIGTQFDGSYVNFQVTAASGNIYRFTQTDLEASTLDPIYTVSLVSGAMRSDTINLWVAVNSSDRADTMVTLTVQAPPQITSITPTKGSPGGNTQVTIKGNGLSQATGVKFGGTAAASYSQPDDSTIIATSPAHAAGTVDITVDSPLGPSTTSAADQFTYASPPTITAITPDWSSPVGGKSITITGTGFTGATSVMFGGNAGTNLVVVGDTSLTVTAPAGAVGTVNVSVTALGGPTTAAGAYRYVGAPSITGVSPGTGSPSGTPVTITGSDLLGTTAVQFNGVLRSFTVVNNNEITTSTPAGTPGTSISLSVTNESGNYALPNAFTYDFTGTTVPDAPTNIGAMVVGDRSASVSFNAPANDGGTPIIEYKVTSNPGGMTATGSTSPLTVTGLNAGASYTFTVTARNAVGSSVDSAASNVAVPKTAQIITFANPGAVRFTDTLTLTAQAASGNPVTFSSSSPLVCTITTSGALTFVSTGSCSITANADGNDAYYPATPITQNFTVYAVVPGAPTIGSLARGNGQLTVYFTPPSSDGGAPISQYTLVASPGGKVMTGTGSPMTMLGLDNGQAYTFTITATNAAGTGSPSAPSASATPMAVQTITATNPGPVNFGSNMQLVATSDAGLQVNFASNTQPVCTVTSTGLLRAMAPGMCTITMTQPGDSKTLPASSVSVSFQIVVPGGAVSISTSGLANATALQGYSQIIQASGGAAPYTFQIIQGRLPTGVTLSLGVISGTPTESGDFPITVQATDMANQTDSKQYTLRVTAPTITIAPGNLSDATVSVPYSQSLSATGGAGNYTYASTGTLPAGVTLSTNGQIAGTPTAAGTANFTVTVTDGLGFTGNQSYSIITKEPPPVAVNDSASTPANTPVTIAVTANDSGSFTSLVVSTAAAHGTTTVNGLSVVYTPSTNFFGSDSFSYTITGPSGSATATVSISVTPLAVPTVIPQNVSVLAGKPVTIHGVAGATGGPYVAVNVPTPPATGTLAISGTDIIYTPAVDASGKVSFDYTLSNPFGSSAPATITVTVNPLPTAPALSGQVLSGSVVRVDLTASAHGGPFTGATLVSVSPSNAGTASITSSGSGYVLNFTAAATFSGAAQLSYTLTNAYATSAPGVVSVVVTARADPSKDAEVQGVLNAQVNAARRMAQGQISNFQQRLERLHGDAGNGGFSNGITLSSASRQNRDPMQGLRNLDNTDSTRRYLVQPDEAAGSRGAASPEQGSLPGGISVWTGGALNFGKTQPGSSDNGIDFSTSGISVGADKRINEKLAVGVGVGYGRDVSDVGQHNSRSTTDSYNLAFYASYHPAANLYVDGLLGYQWLSFDARRYVSADGSTASGSRDGKQLFGSLALGYEQRKETWMLSPYARLDVAHAQLDAYTEQAQASNALSYNRQTVKTTTGNLGLRAEWTLKADYGTWVPALRAEYQHDFQGSSVAAMRYADLLSGPMYQTSMAGQSSNRTMLGAGLQLQTLKGWLIRFEYQNTIESSSRENQSLLLGVEKKFDP